MNPLLTIALTFVLTAGLVYASAEGSVRSRRRLHERLAAVIGRAARPAAPAEPAAETIRPDSLPTLTRWLNGRDFEPRLRLAMLRADLRLRPAEWVALCAASAIAAGLFGLLAAHSLLTGLVLALLGLSAPLLILSTRQTARRRRFDGQLPDALMLLTSALRAGYSFGQSMQMIAEELPPPLAAEFAWASGEVRLGVPLETALGRIMTRVQSPEFDLIVTAILIQLPMGGNLAEVLDAIAETIRERVRVAGEVQTLTAEGRLSAIILIVLAPLLALVLHLRSPDYFQPLLDSSNGRLLLSGAFFGQIVGGLVIHRMVSVEL